MFANSVKGYHTTFADRVLDGAPLSDIALLFTASISISRHSELYLTLQNVLPVAMKGKLCLYDINS